MRPAFTKIELIVVVGIISVGLCFLGVLEPLDGVGFQLAVGWVLFLWRVLPQMRIDWGSTATAVGCLTGLAVGLHLFLSWLYRQTRGAGVAEAGSPARWRLRWTGMILGVVVLMFTAGVSAVGMAHQTAWLLTSPVRLTRTTGGLRGAAARMNSMNNLKQMGLAVHQYHLTRKGKLPPGSTFDPQGNALHGWQTFLLPYIEQEDLFKTIDQQTPWSDPKHAAAFCTPVPIFLHPLEREQRAASGYALTHYAANVRVLGGNQVRNIASSVPDGASNTILAGEVWAQYSPWGRPGNWRDPARGLHTTRDSFGSPHRADTTQILLMDGSVRSVKGDISPAVLEALSTPDGGETIDPADW